MDGTRRVLAALAAIALTGAVGGCAADIPVDPEGTYDRVSGGELRVGASPDGELVTVEGATTGTERVEGVLADLVEDFAESIDAEVAWTVGSEESLVTAIEEGDLDLAIGGMTDQTPWAGRVGVTRGFADLPGVEREDPVVMLAPLGENRFIGELERFLDERSAG
ncbi:hypothetical protein [Microbacterium sp. MEC084]|uniref:hypothetical protein n=1 Tax=Microbacterium sp. MEC084 TaxID=1963027 RepID=UPI0011035B25|nr:hypothetical protein [Microbacterium sp. MEC084]